MKSILLLFLVVALVLSTTARQLSEEFASDNRYDEFVRDNNRDSTTFEDYPMGPWEKDSKSTKENFPWPHDGIPREGIPRESDPSECSLGMLRSRDIYTIGSEPKFTILGYNLPFYMELTNDGRVFLTEYNTSYVHIIDQRGKHLNKFSIPKGRPTGLALNGDLVYVTNHIEEIYIFDANNGKLLGLKNASKPVALAFDENGLMYETEWTTGKINVYHRDGRKSHTITVPGKGNVYLRKIQFDSKGDLYIPQYYSSTIHIYSKSGDFQRKITVPGVKAAEGLFIDSKGLIYLTDRSTYGKKEDKKGKVIIMDASGKVLKTIQGHFKGVSDVAVAPDGTLWVVDYLGHRIYQY